MLKQIWESINFVSFFTSNKVGKTGLPVTVDVYKNGVLALANQAATESAGGLYAYTLEDSHVNVAGNYIAIFKTTDTTVDVQHVPSFYDVGGIWVEYISRDLNSFSDAVITYIESVPNSVRDNFDANPISVNVTDKTGFALSSDAQSALATVLEGRLINDGDGQVFVQAVVNAIGNSNIDQVVFVNALIAGLERAGGTLAAVKDKIGAVPTAAQNATAVRSQLSDPVLQAAALAGVTTNGKKITSTDSGSVHAQILIGS